jgi:hypothetical protein
VSRLQEDYTAEGEGIQVVDASPMASGGNRVDRVRPCGCNNTHSNKYLFALAQSTNFSLLIYEWFNTSSLTDSGGRLRRFAAECKT